ncbi:MAG TPA: aromatic ring-hydroxylating dioxygenase subunit alpha [Gemmatimonadales bacterium]|nr:aromatic ring-hydroxylating dioxygenase subunit alpha [Gemmatimonadales bacterium]
MERTLHRDFYLTEQVFCREQEGIFYREWVCGGREAEISEPGSYRALDVAGESVLVLRTREGKLAGYYNVCRHRGSRLVAEGSAGAFRGSIRCPYHSWTYSLDGQLRTAPFLEEGEVTRSELGLFPIGLECWGGFFFLNLTPGEASARGYDLASQLGSVPQRVQRYPLEELRSAHRITYDVAANWKVLLENYNECYHCGPVHPELCRLVPAFKQRGGSELDWDRGIPHREGAWTFTETGTSNRRPFPRLNDDEQVRHKGELIYPNCMISLSADHVTAYTICPRSAGRTLVICDFLFHPSEIESPGFDPTDAITFWDRVNRQDWAICESVQRGMQSRVFQQGYYAPMESASLDIRRYVGEKLGEAKGDCS